MRFLITGICAALAFASPATAEEDFSWQKASDRKVALGAFNNFADFCTGFDYQRVALPAGTDLDKKMHAHLLLASSAEYEFLHKWLGYITDWTQLEKALKDETLLDRAADALIAAENDPDAYAKAEKLYVDTAIKPFERAFDACARASKDEFVGKYYVTGTGSLVETKATLRKGFEEGMKRIWAEAKALQ
jgi:hypothetical protein